MQKMKMNKTRQELANMFISSLQEGKLPWRACWQISIPENSITHTRYGESSFGTCFQGTQRFRRLGCGQYAQDHVGRAKAGA